jgi:hypothetical protein
MGDAKEILGLHKVAGLGASAEKRKTPKDAFKKPDGVSREVYALTGGLPPIMPTLDPSSLKRRQIPSKKVQMPSLRSLHLTAEVYNEHQTKKPIGWDSWPHCMLLGVVSTTTCRRCSP